MPDLRALAFALAQRGLVLAASNSEEDSESVGVASELGTGCGSNTPAFLGTSSTGTGRGEYRLELRLGEGGPRGAALIGELSRQGEGGGGGDFEGAHGEAHGK